MNTDTQRKDLWDNWQRLGYLKDGLQGAIQNHGGVFTNEELFNWARESQRYLAEAAALVQKTMWFMLEHMRARWR